MRSGLSFFAARVVASRGAFAGLMLVIAASPAGSVPLCPPAWGLPDDPPSWCDRTSAGPDGVLGTADDDSGCVEHAGIDGNTDCATTVASEWSFREGEFCRNCPHVYYVRIDCAAEFHLPRHDVEAMTVVVTDLATGERALLTGENECAVRREAGDPFVYCDGCASADALFPKDDEISAIGKPAGTCMSSFGSFPERECLAWRETGTTVGWGRPLDPDGDGLFDSNGDGFVDVTEDPPCEDCRTADCPCGKATGSAPVAEEQVVDVVLKGDRFRLLSGVYRMEILSGGFVWKLFANCDGAEAPLYPLYASCADALADWDPRPELALPDRRDDAVSIDSLADCPDSVSLDVTTCNAGGVAATSAPFTITFDDAAVAPFDGDNTAHPSDPACQGPLEPGECRTCTWQVPLGTAPLIATVTLDAADELAECSENETGVRCPISLSRSRSLSVCGDAGDSDSDGLADWREIETGADPHLIDTDGDGVRDAEEVEAGTDPARVDTDADGISDADDLCPVTPDPEQQDADGDGVGDACEPGARDVVLRVMKRGDDLLAEWGSTEGASPHDLMAGDLATLHEEGAAAPSAVLACGWPTGPAARPFEDAAGESRSRYYLLSVELPDGAELGVRSDGVARELPGDAAHCR